MGIETEKQIFLESFCFWNWKPFLTLSETLLSRCCGCESLHRAGNQQDKLVTLCWGQHKAKFLEFLSNFSVTSLDKYLCFPCNFAWTLHCSSPSAVMYQAENTIPVLQVVGLWECMGIKQGYSFVDVLLHWWWVALEMERIGSHLVLHFLAYFFVFTDLVFSGGWQW